MPTMVYSVLAMMCLLSVALPGCAFCQDVSQGVQQHFQAARAAQAAGSLATAAAEYKIVVQLDPTLPEGYANLGLVYFALNKFEESARALEAANRLRPHLFGVNLYLGIDDVKRNQAALAIPRLQEACRLEPRNKDALHWLATALWDSGQTYPALLQLRKASAIFRSDPDVRFALAEAYRKAADEETEQTLVSARGSSLSDLIYGDIYADESVYNKAIGHYQRASERDPHRQGAHLGLAKVYLAQGQLETARLELTRELEVAPSSVSARARLGEALILQGKVEDGLEQLREAVAVSAGEASDALGLHPNLNGTGQGTGQGAGASDEAAVNAAIRSASENAIPLLEAAPASASRTLALACMYRLAMQEKESDQQLLEFLSGQRETREPITSYSQAVAAYQHERFQEAQDWLERQLRSHPEDLEARYLLARTERQESMTVMRAILSVDPDSYRVHQLLAQMYANREEDEQAIAEYQIVERMEPTLPDVHFSLGHLYWKHGNAQEAIDELNRELALDPNHAEANGELGAILVSKREPDAALPYLERAIQIKPDLWPVYEQLGRAYYLQKNYPRAEAMLRKALPNDLDGSAHFQLGRVYLAEGHAKEAEEQFAIVKRIKLEKLDDPGAGRLDEGSN